MDPTLRTEAHAFLGGVSRELDCPPEAIGGTADHLHALVKFGRTITIADYVKESKRVTTSWLRTRAPSMHAFHWQSGYGAFSVSASNVPDVIEYIRTQDEHHKRCSFQDEFRALMRCHGLTLDERYAWD